MSSEPRCVNPTVVQSPPKLNSSLSLDNLPVSWDRKNWLGSCPFWGMQPSRRATGQSMQPVLPKEMIAPWPNRSVPEWRRWIEITEGAWYESTTSLSGLNPSGVKAWQDGQADSPSHRNPKSQRCMQASAPQHQTGSPDAHETTPGSTRQQGRNNQGTLQDWQLRPPRTRTSSECKQATAQHRPKARPRDTPSQPGLVHARNPPMDNRATGE